MKLYYHKTDGGAEYLMDTFIKWEHNGKKGKEGVFNSKTKYVVRIDGDIRKDAELSIREKNCEHKNIETGRADICSDCHEVIDFQVED